MFIIKFIIAILMFSAIILFHELGHFLLAKKNDIYVEEFALGIGPTLLSKKKGETEYGIKAFPFGGCCVMRGEDGEDDDPRAFGNKSAAARFMVVFAGPFFNFILAFFLALFVIGIGGADPAIVGQKTENSAAYEAGLREGDTILKLDHSKVYTFREVRMFNFFHSKNPKVKVTYKRDGKVYHANVVRNKDPETGMYMLGITSAGYIKQNLAGIIRYSLIEVRYQIWATLTSLKYLVTGNLSFNDLSGPVGIVKTIGDTYDQSVPEGVRYVVLNMLSLAILLSANLGVMNLLPLPALDGGRLVFIIIELVTKKKVPPEKEGLVHTAGLVLLMTLMVIIMANDIRMIFTR